MTVTVAQVWEVVGQLPDGHLIRSAAVYDNTRLIGRVIDIGGVGFRADFVDRDGEVKEVMAPDIYTAVLVLAEEARARFKRLN